MKNCIGIIPARYASTRFPGKPLVDIAGKSMIERVYEQAKKSSLRQVIVATDDERIQKAVTAFGGKVCMTSIDHQSGTDRCAEVIQKLSLQADAVINIQGDEPFIDPRQIDLVCSCFDDDTVELATLVKKVDNPEILFNPNAPKVILDKDQNAIYFSRHPIPYLRGVEEEGMGTLHPPVIRDDQIEAHEKIEEGTETGVIAAANKSGNVDVLIFFTSVDSTLRIILKLFFCRRILPNPKPDTVKAAVRNNCLTA